jgi:hypothetical protein
MLSVEGWRGSGILVMACQAAGQGRSLEGLVTPLFVVEVGSSRSGRYRGCRHNWETAAGLCVLLKRL